MNNEALHFWHPVIVLVVESMVIATALDYARSFVRETTLVAPWRWGLTALAALVGVELAAVLASGEGPPRWLGAARYIAAVATFCPIIAVLGAKRPQDRAWHLIVAALWFVLALPAFQDLIYHYGQPVALDPAWRAFVAVLIGVGLVNYLPTRFWPASLLYAAGQFVLLADYLPWGDRITIATAWRVPAALGVFAGAAILPVLGWPRRRPARDTHERLWCDFRDAYGMLWAVRIGRRAEETAHAGSRDPGDASAAATASRDAAERTFIAHLQRFVPRAWIDERLAALTPSPSGRGPG
ncbi:MAG TPA: hypothetical protein VHD36_17010 [Pirellulales bacterium]|nr:hypothetical protein [Pirellulales bacterium]